VVAFVRLASAAGSSLEGTNETPEGSELRCEDEDGAHPSLLRVAVKVLPPSSMLSSYTIARGP